MNKKSYITPLLLLTGLILLSYFLLFITNRYILTVNFYERNGQPISGMPDMESLVYDRIKTLVYLYAVIYLIVKIIVITIILSSALYFFDIEVRFLDLFRVVVLCEYLFLIPAAAKIVWFWNDRNVIDLITWQNFYFLSCTTFVSEIRPAFLLPLQTLNVFEVAYCVVLAEGIAKITGTKMRRSLKIVGSSYVPAVFIWVLFVVYLTIVYFPNSY